MADKKSIFQLPKSEEKGSIKWKNIGIIVVVIGVIVVVSFLSFGSKKEEKVKTVVNKGSKIDESETISTSEEITEKMKNNPILSMKEDNETDLELEKLKLQQEHELKMLQFQLQQERIAWEKERKKATLNLLSGTTPITTTNKGKNPYDIEIPPFPDYPKEDPNLQESKQEFINTNVDEFILQKRLVPAISKYEVKAGTIIPLTLETAINSDLPGRITAIVKTDIFDSATGNILLIPAGSKVIGRYNSDVSFGQERVQVVFDRITLPNQKSIAIDSMIGVDKLGASGVSDMVDTKLGKVFTSVIMSAILGVGSGAVKDKNDDNNWKNNAIDGGANQTINVGNTYANKVLNVQPSLKIRAGYTIGVFVTKDLILEPYND